MIRKFNIILELVTPRGDIIKGFLDQKFCDDNENISPFLNFRTDDMQNETAFTSCPITSISEAIELLENDGRFVEASIFSYDPKSIEGVHIAKHWVREDGQHNILKNLERALH